MARLILFNKPFGVLSQFTDATQRRTLADYITAKNVYAAGRLDKDSEGLLLLTDNGALQHRIANPRKKLPKHYWVQVEGVVSDMAINELQEGVQLNDGVTLPAKVKRIDEPTNLWSRTPPIRFRKNVPTQWLNIILQEGKNRQVRRMTAAVNHPTLRLIRHRIGNWRLEKLQPGNCELLEVSDIDNV